MAERLPCVEFCSISLPLVEVHLGGRVEVNNLLDGMNFVCLVRFLAPCRFLAERRIDQRSFVCADDYVGLGWLDVSDIDVV